MLTELYIEVLLVDEELADPIWEAWDTGEIDDRIEWLAWWLVSLDPKQSYNFLLRLRDNNDKGKPSQS